MKKLFFIPIILILLASCDINITTFKEKIADGKVEIDGIEYTINQTNVDSYEYDSKGKIISKKNNASTTEYIYEGELLTQVNMYTDNSLLSYRNFIYEDDVLVRDELYFDDLNQFTDYTYKENFRELRTRDVNSGIVGITMEELDEDGNLITKEIRYLSTLEYINEENNVLKDTDSVDEEDGVMSLELCEVNPQGPTVRKYYYVNNFLSKSEVTRDGDIISEIYYEYNNIGDEIVNYALVYGGEGVMLFVSLFEYEYNHDKLPQKITEYRVHSVINQENIRVYD